MYKIPELKPCPCCGKTQQDGCIIFVDESLPNIFEYVYCFNCGFSSPKKLDSLSFIGGVTYWNNIKRPLELVEG